MGLIKKVEKFERRSIDLTGPDGNVFALMGIATRWANQIDKTKTQDIIDQMTSGDYTHAVAVFEINFGMLCDLEMDERMVVEVAKRVEGIRETNNVVWDLKELGYE